MCGHCLNVCAAFSLQNNLNSAKGSHTSEAFISILQYVNKQGPISEICSLSCLCRRESCTSEHSMAKQQCKQIKQRYRWGRPQVHLWLMSELNSLFSISPDAPQPKQDIYVFSWIFFFSFW